MDLILWRHAEAVDLREGETDDLSRALTPKGERNAARMAQWLNQVLPATTRVLVSPALRTQQTAAALERKFKTVAALAPDGTVDALLDVARWPEARGPRTGAGGGPPARAGAGRGLPVVGHGPALEHPQGCSLVAALPREGRPAPGGAAGRALAVAPLN
jgi:hypothetical protein